MKMYFKFFKTSTDPKCITDLAGKFKDVNPAFTQTFGFTQSEIASKRLIDFILPQHQEVSAKQLMDDLMKKRSVEYGDRFQSNDGCVRWLSWHLSLDEAEGLIYGTARDITTRKQSGKNLLELNQDFVTLLEKATDFIYFKDQNGRIRFCSQTMADITGYSNWRDLIGKHDREIFPEETARIYHEEELPVFRDGKPLLNKIDPYFDRQGNRRWVSTNKWPVFGSDNKTVEGIFGISRDITERKLMEETLHIRQQKLEAILLSAPVAIAVSADRTITVANDRFCEPLGYSRAEVLGMPTRRLYPSEKEYRETGDVFYTALKNRTGFETETQLRRKDGAVIDVLLSMNASDPNNPVAEATFMLLDITERKRADRELKRYASELAEANKVKDIFTDVLRHDIMNPVAAIQLLVQLLSSFETDPKKSKILKTMQNSVTGLIEMTENAAKFAKITTLDQIEYSTTNLTKLIQELVLYFEAPLKERDMTIAFDTGQTIDVQVNPMIKETFANIISNAIKYGLAPSEIRIGIKDKGDSVVVFVKNRGENIPDEYKKRIFNRFERIGKEGVKGSGLGLAIAHQVVSMHRGDIWVEDNPSGGCVFLVQLPKVQNSQ